jgi:hypothetical protein
MTIEEFFSEWEKQINSEDKEEIEMYKKAIEKVGAVRQKLPQ